MVHALEVAENFDECSSLAPVARYFIPEPVPSDHSLLGCPGLLYSEERVSYEGGSERSLGQLVSSETTYFATVLGSAVEGPEMAEDLLV